MTERAKEARRQYYRKWRKQNPDKAQAIVDRHWEKVAEAMAAQNEEKGVVDNGKND